MKDVPDDQLNVENAIAKLALDDAIAVLERTQKPLMQDAYYRQEALRLL